MSWDEGFEPQSIEEALDHGCAAFLCTEKKYLIYVLEDMEVLNIYMHQKSFTREAWNDLYDEIKNNIDRLKEHPTRQRLSVPEDPE
jgi:hypothetical protein